MFGLSSHASSRFARAVVSARRASRSFARPPARLGAAALSIALAGCAIAPETPPPAQIASPRWSAPLPHDGSPEALAGWWARFGDPALGALIESAQRDSPTLEQAAQRIFEARANARIAGAARWPALDARATATRGNTLLIAAGSASPSTMSSATLDAAWEIDLFGAARNQAAAARARAEGAETQWHAARVSLAAEVADAYTGVRACEALLEIEQAQSQSLARSAELTRQKVEAGFESPGNGALARASAAESRARAVAQRAECDAAIQLLAMLCAMPEARLRPLLVAGRARLPEPSAFEVPAIPAQVLLQRPDLAAAEQAVAAAAADVGVAEADRYPRISLTGSIGRTALRIGGNTLSGNSWSIGPSLLLPLFDAGRRGAAVDAARARMHAARADWHARALAAVREVEEALVRLDAAGERMDDVNRAVDGYETFLAAATTQWEVGVGSLLDLEQARRNVRAARAALVQTRRERVVSWLALYKAVGGGWQPAGDGSPTSGGVPVDDVSMQMQAR